MNISEDRKYVIVCNRSKAYVKGALLFWGNLTDDSAARRSFCGYTCRVDNCERYTRKELEEWRGNNNKNYPFFDELTESFGIAGRRVLRSHDDVLISIDELNKLGYRVFEVMVLA